MANGLLSRVRIFEMVWLSFKIKVEASCGCIPIVTSKFLFLVLYHSVAISKDLMEDEMEVPVNIMRLTPTLMACCTTYFQFLRNCLLVRLIPMSMR